MKPWAVQVTVAAIIVNAQANSSPKRHEPLQGVGTHLLLATSGGLHLATTGAFFMATDSRGLHTFRTIWSVLDDLEYSHSASAHLVPASA